MPDISDTQKDSSHGIRLGLPSASDVAFWNCDGKQQLLASIGPVVELPNEDALVGTRIHEAFHTDNTLPLLAEEYETYQKGLTFTKQLVRQWQVDRELPQVSQEMREVRLWLHDLHTLSPIASGQIDRFYIEGKNGAVLDFKTGFNPNLVPSPRSSQLRLYAVLLWKEYPHLTNIRVAFCKPLSYAGAGDYCDYSLSDLEAAEQLIRFQIWRSKQPDARRTPGQHCWWCPCKAHCPEAGSYSLLPGVIAQKASVGSTDPTDMVLSLTHADLLKIWNASGTVKRILDAVKERLEGLPKEELAELGLELPSVGKRRDTIVDVKAAFEYLHNEECWPEEQLWQLLSLTKGAVADLAMQKNSLDKKHAAKWAETVLEPWINHGNDKPSLKKL